MKGLEQSPELTLVRLESAGWPDELPAFGKQIGVESLAFGFSSRSMEGVSIEMKMLDVVTGENSWSQTYTGNDKPVPEITLTIANKLLQAKGLSKLEERQFTGTRHSSAYQAFLDGMMTARSLDGEHLTGAIEYFETAINDDPGYSLAYTGLAQAAYDLMAMNNISESESQALEQRASHAVDMARKLDPDSADAISLFALELDNSQLRIQAWERALELDSDHVISLYRYAMQLKEDGKLAEAERLLRRAVRLSPMNARFRNELAAIIQYRHPSN
jgi:tetratricopeptide (TPR) repeat protein